jgi:hypothetical protein
VAVSTGTAGTASYCHEIAWLSSRFGLVIRFIGNFITQIVAILNRSLSRRDQCSQSRSSLLFLVTSSNSGRSFATVRAGWWQFIQIQVQVQVQVILRPAVSRPVCLGVGPPYGANHQILLLSNNWGLRAVGRPPWLEDGSVIYSYN